MKKSGQISIWLLCGIVVLGMMGCASTPKITYYLNYNFHYTIENGTAKGSIANYTNVVGHKILPYGTQVTIKSARKGFLLIDQKSGNQIHVLATSAYLLDLSLSDYIELILSRSPISYAGLSEIDMKGISEGKPYIGMTKQGVMIALGYPCPHRTTSPDSNVWIYWRNRLSNYNVNFENGIVVSTRY